MVYNSLVVPKVVPVSLVIPFFLHNNFLWYEWWCPKADTTFYCSSSLASSGLLELNIISSIASAASSCMEGKTCA